MYSYRPDVLGADPNRSYDRPVPAIYLPGLVQQSLLWLVVPFATLIALTLALDALDFDRVACRLFLADDGIHFPALDADWCLFLYRYGTLPALALGLGGIAVAVLSRWVPELRPFRRAGLFMGLLLALGPGLAVNGILKPVCVRPRPSELEEFGGDAEFVSALCICARSDEVSKSFPSGHASMGFFLLAPSFFLYARRPRWAFSFVLLGLLMGGLLGVSRIAQGRHFPTDVLWAGAMVYFSGLVLSRAFRLVEQFQTPFQHSSLQRDEPPEEEPAVVRIEDYLARDDEHLAREAASPNRKPFAA